MEVASATETIMANPSSEFSNGPNITTSSLLSEASATKAMTFSSESSFNLLTVHNQNGQYIIQQPLKTVNNGQALVSNGAALSKGQIIVRQKSLSANQQTSASTAAAFLGDRTDADRPGVKRPLTSSDNNVITKVIITKNPVSGQNQVFPVGAPIQAFAMTSLPGGGNLTNGSIGSHSSSAAQSAITTKTMMQTFQGALSPVKTMIATIQGTGAPIFSAPFQKIPTSPTKTPTKLTMIPVSGSLNRQSLNSNITVFSCALNTASQAGSVPKVIIKQGSAPTGSSSITLKGQALPTLAPQSVQVAQSVRAPHVIHNMQPVTVGSARTIQQIQVPGSRFHYVRLVSPVSNSSEATMTAAKPNAGTITQVVQAPLNAVPVTIAPAPIANQVKMTLPFQQQNTPLAPKPAAIPVSVNTQQSVHQIILPATSSSSAQSSVLSSLVSIQPAPSAPTQSINQLPPGTAILSAANSNMQGIKSFALVPASYVTQLQLQQQLSKSQLTQATTAPSAPRQARDYVPIASIDPAITQYTVSRNAPNNTGATLEATGARPRKPCNCTKSQCLKLYCDCFANGEFCQNCNCTHCANNLEHEEERSKAIKSCLDRNPQAFHPKIGKSREVEGSRQHNKGCNCKRSGCLKNYCECYEAKIMCSNYCKCIGCKNFEESPERKTLMHLADAAEVRVQQQTAAKTKLSSQISCVPSRPPVATANGERLPFALITADVAEATSACLLAQAEEAERMKMPPVVQERMIIEEFGRCLLQIIESANRTRKHLTWL